MKTSLLILSFAALAGQLPAQYAESRRASIRGGGSGDGGKCTIEVDVDDVAEVEVRGDMGRIRTLSGQRATWRRFECSGPLPGNPVDFRFQGVDGRGNVNLIADPQSARGAAIVRIEDRQGGREGYTFDLEWRGGSGSYDGRNDQRRDRGAFGDRGVFGDRRTDADRDGINDRRGRYTLTCEANGNRRRLCEAETSGGVRLMREFGNRACRQGSSWGYDRRGIWVDRGCAAEFEVGR